MHRGGDPLRVAPDTTNIDSAFLPDSHRASFKVGAYWVKERFVRVFRGTSLGSVERYFFREFRGSREVLFLVHPTSSYLYSTFLRDSAASEAFPESGGLRVSPTSSTRTVLVWPQQWITEPFFAKLSLDGTIGEVDRKLTSEALARSVGVSQIIHAASPDLPNNFKFLSETLAITPNQAKGYGFLVRPVPIGITSNDFELVPFFSLYSRLRGSSMLEKIIRGSGKNAIEFLTENLLTPFAKQWTRLVVEEGFIPEPHAQNLLMEFDSQGLSTGVFVHRDLESFFIDLTHRRQTGKPLPAHLPMVSPLPQNYSQYRLFHRAFNSVYRYFQGTILYEINRILPQIIENNGEGHSFISSDIEHIFVKELEYSFSYYTNNNVQLGGFQYKRNLKKAIIKARKEFFH